MLMLVSPAKTLDFETMAASDLYTKPVFLPEAQTLVNILQDYDIAQLQKLMGLSEKLAILNVDRFAHWQKATTPKKGKQAMYAFRGDVYTGLAADTFKAADYQRAQKYLRILSGLYGLLRPMDIIMPYRLEMGTQLKNEAGKDLYTFWRDKVTDAVNKDLETTGSKFLLNLASKEYFGALHPKRINVDIISPEFKDYRNGQYKIISFYAKKARGLMARYCIENKVEDMKKLLKFNLNGYYYDEERSTPLQPVFLRDNAEE